MSTKQNGRRQIECVSELCMATKKAKKKEQIQVSNARKIISSFYFKLFTLMSYIRKVKTKNGHKLIQDGDPADYKFLLKSTLVAVPRDQSAIPPFKPSHTQWFTLKEITNRVIEHVCRSNKTNVLSFGFEPLSGHGKNGTVAGTVGIQNSYPNTIVSYLRTAKAWLMLHERIGDDLMIHLLQNVAVFVKATSKCYFQVAGFPISRLTPLTAKDVPHQLADSKQRMQQPPSDEAQTARCMKKMRRGGKRVKRSRDNLANQKEGEVLIVHNTVTGISNNVVDMELCDVATTNSSEVTANQLDGPELCKRRSSNNINNTQEEPQVKKARTSSNVDEVSLVLFPVEASGNSTECLANTHTVSSSSVQNHSEMADHENNEVLLSLVKDGEHSKNVLTDSEMVDAHSAQTDDIEMSSPKDVLPESCDVEVSPLLFPEDTGENSMSESNHFCNASELLSSKNACGSGDVTMSLFQEDTETLLECGDGHRVGDDSSRSQEKEKQAKPVEKKDMLKRKKSISNAGVNEKGANKAMNRRKPWHYLLKLLPQPGQSKSLKRKDPAPKGQEKSQTQKSNRKQLDKREGHPTSKTRIQGIHLNEVYLPRSRLFYASNLSQTFPKHHVMETTPVSMNGARKLVHRIFFQGNLLLNSGNKVSSNKKDGQNVKNVTGASNNQKQTPSKKKKPFRLPKRLKRIQLIVLKFLARHQKCPFRTLLKHHCFYTERRTRVNKNAKKKKVLARIAFSVPKRMVQHKCPWKRGGSKGFKRAYREKKPKVDVLVYRHAVSNHTKHDQVVRFLECICHKVVPSELWGSSQNKRTFLRNLAKFVRLHRGEKFSLGQMMEGIKVSSCEWLKMNGEKGKHVPLSDSLKQQQLLAQFIWWFVTQYLVPVLKSFFYITESGTHRQRIFYYRKPVWAKIQRFGVNTFCGEFFKPLTTKEAKKLLGSKSSLGFSPLRFIPKSSTVRPITNMRHCPTKKEPINAQKQQSINRKLQNLFEVLKFEKERNPKSLGATLFGSDDIYRVLKPFAERVRSSLEGRPLFFVHVDVKHCYESIPHQKLFEIMKEVLEEEEYLIRRFSLLRMKSGKVYRVFHKHVSTADDCRSFPDFFRSLITAWRLKQVIAVDNVWYLTEDRDKLMDLLKEHIFNNIVRIGNIHYQQIRGIAQGSILSTILCGYFYSRMEKTHLSDLSRDPDSLLLRWVDDFLLITPQKSLAANFLNVMHAGIPEYGCFINRDKTLTNFDAVTGDVQAVKRIGASERFPWCGYLLDTVTLEVRSDLSRYTGLLLRDTLSVALDAHPGQALRRKLLYSVRPKCHPLLLDHNLNSRESVLLNVYQLFLLTAYKFHTYAKELPRGRQPKDNPSFFCGVVIDLAQYFHSTSSRKSRQLSHNKATFSLDEREVTWLCFHAFRTCLRRKQSRYAELLTFLGMGLSRLGRLTEELKKITDASQHAVFKDIR